MFRENLLEWAASRGYKLAWGPASLVSDVARDMNAMKERKEIDPGFYSAWLAGMRYLEGSCAAQAQTVLVLAVPKAAHTASFDFERGRLDAMIPPTYVDYNRLRTTVRSELKASLFDTDDSLEPISAPLKTIAARLGLVQWGRNNITYAAGLGSYHQLLGYVTNRALSLPAGREAGTGSSLRTCDSCRICMEACPTGAIPHDRFLIRAEQCLVYYNESKGPWPDRLPASAHRCLIGCMACQEVCPENAGLLRIHPADVSFSLEETGALVEGDLEKKGAVWERIRAKLERLDMLHDEPVLGRNLLALARNPALNYR